MSPLRPPTLFLKCPIRNACENHHHFGDPFETPVLETPKGIKRLLYGVFIEVVFAHSYCFAVHTLALDSDEEVVEVLYLYLVMTNLNPK